MQIQLTDKTRTGILGIMKIKIETFWFGSQRDNEMGMSTKQAEVGTVVHNRGQDW